MNIGSLPQGVVSITGPMFAGKTTKLLEYYNLSNDYNIKTQIFKPLIDNRYSNNEIVNHDGICELCEIIEPKESLLERITNETESIFIDEAQFLDAKFLPELFQLKEQGKNIYLSFLNYDATGKHFPLDNGLVQNFTVTEYLNMSTITIPIRANCVVCKEPADYTHRKGQNKDTVLVGGKELYEPRCLEHFLDVTVSK